MGAAQANSETKEAHRRRGKRPIGFDDLRSWLESRFFKWREGCERRMAARGEIELRLLDFRYYLLTVECRWLLARSLAPSPRDREAVWDWWRRLHFVNQLQVIGMRPIML